MAIRSGTGGLKYPLPNQAQLVAQQSAAAASSGGSAAASAYGSNLRYAGLKRQLAAQAYQGAANRQFQALSQLEAQNFRAQSQLEGQRFSAEQGALTQQAYDDRQKAQFAQQKALQQAGQQFSADQAVLQDTRQSDRDLRLYNQKLVGSLPEIPENAQPQTRRHLQTLATALQELSGQSYDPRDPSVAEKFNESLQSYNSIVQSIPKPTLDDQFQKNTLEKNGRLYQFDPKSKQFSELSDGGQKEAAKQQAEQQKAQQQHTAEQQRWIDDKVKSLMDEVDQKTNKPKYTYDTAFPEARKEAEKYFNARNQTTSGEQPAAGGGQQTPGTDQGAPQRPVDLAPGRTEVAPSGANLLPPDTPAYSGTPSTSAGAGPGSYVPRQPPALPTASLPVGLPQGSQAVDENTIVLPDGRVMKRKALQ